MGSAELIIFAVIGLLLLGVIGISFYALTRMNEISRRITENAQAQQGTTESFAEIQRTLGQLTEAGRRMEQVSKEVSGLSDLLKAPKIRGGVGELLLGDLLSQMLAPDQYKVNHTFRTGDRVDAVIRLQAGMVPVDSKFPLESFQRTLASDEEVDRIRHKKEFARAVKKHADDIARKYILPDEGTFDFALMYIPAENVYYETIIKDDQLGEETSILGHALDKHVIPVSPNSFYAYLQAIAMGFRGLQIEKQAKEIMGFLDRLVGDIARFRSDYNTMGGHLENARKKYDEAERRLGRFEEKLGSARDAGKSVPGQEQTRLESDLD
jgi:DNA recombination protein RmuC